MEENLNRLHQQFINYSLTFKGNSIRTTTVMEVMFRTYQRFSGANALSDFTLESVEDWLSHGRTTLSWSAKTIHLYRCYMKLFGDWCVRRGHLESNFVEEIPSPRLRKRIPKSLDEEECENLLAWARNFPFAFKFERMRAIAIIATFLATGIRRSELENLTMENINLDRKELYVRNGKGGKDRRIPFRPSLARVLNEYLKERKRLKKCCPFFFTAMRQDSKMGDRVIQRLVARLRERSGIYFTPHKLRHTYATRMLQNGLDIREVQELMGHSDITTTAIYLSVTDKRIKEQVLSKGFDV